MKKLNFPIDDSLHTTLKLFCVRNGWSITQYVLGLIEKDLLERGEIEEEQI